MEEREKNYHIVGCPWGYPGYKKDEMILYNQFSLWENLLYTVEAEIFVKDKKMISIFSSSSNNQQN